MAENKRPEPDRGPPKEVEASELYQLLMQLPRAHEIVDFPRKLPNSEEPVGQLAIVPLSQEQVMAAQASADVYAKKVLNDPQMKDHANLGYQGIYQNACAVELVWRACFDVKDASLTRHVFPSPKALRQMCTADQITVLALHCQRAERLLGPIIAFMTEPELEAWIEKLRVGGKQFPLDLLSSEMKDALIWHLIARLEKSLTASSSAGSPPGASALPSEETAVVDDVEPVPAADADATAVDTSLDP